MASREFGINRRTLSSKLTFEWISPGADQRYTTKDFHKAICGDIHSKRQRLLDAQAQRIELEIEQTRSKLIDRMCCNFVVEPKVDVDDRKL
jgi:hypothetical protein